MREGALLFIGETSREVLLLRWEEDVGAETEVQTSLSATLWDAALGADKRTSLSDTLARAFGSSLEPGPPLSLTLSPSPPLLPSF
mmetsp:Transcript_27169/g.39994  ORF Transcript_27169/g.39994 Transcript_27169/m.39994 type:complete len:85 (-) Transcript_27169:384-638(-)